jgi:hypothetical protein
MAWCAEASGSGDGVFRSIEREAANSNVIYGVAVCRNFEVPVRAFFSS